MGIYYEPKIKKSTWKRDSNQCRDKANNNNTGNISE